MDLAALKNYLAGKGSPLDLSADDAGLPPELRDFLGTVPNKKVKLTPGEGGINLQGSTLTVSGASTAAWPVQGMQDVSVTLSDFAVVIDDSGASPSVGGTAHGTLPLTANAHAQVVLTALHQDAKPWQVKLTQAAQGPTPTDLLLLGRVGGLPFEIPPNLDVLSRVLTVPQDKFQITFYPNTTHESRYSFVLSAPDARWTLIDKVLAFQGIDLDAFVMTNSVFVRLVGHLSVGGVGVDVGVALDAGPDWVAFVEPSQGDAFPGLSALASWIGGDKLSGDVSSGLSSVKLGTAGFDAAIEKVSVGFKWQSLALNYVDIQSLLTVGALKLDVSLRLPDIEMSGGLHAGEAVKVRDLLASYGLKADGVPDDLSVADVEFYARPKAGYYSVGVTVDNVWKAGPVDLEEVSALVSYDTAAGFAGNFYCRLGVGATAKLDLEADYVAGSGWRFSGGTAPGTTLAIGDLISDLATRFGIASVPGPIAGLTLSDLDVSYETGTGKFNFTCVGGFDVAETPVTLTVTIDVTPTQAGDAGKTGTVTGTKGYSATFGGKVEFSGLEFDLVFDTQSTGTNIFVAAFKGDEKAPPTVNLHDLVADVSKDLASAVPASLSIDLKAVKFIFLQQPQQPRQFSFGLELGASISLSDLPLVGDRLPPAETIGVNSLQIGYSNLAFTKAQADIVNPLLPQGVSPIPEAGLAQGVNVAATLQLGPSTKLPLLLGGGGGQSPAAATGSTGTTQPAAPAGGGTPATTTAPASSIKWFDVQKQFGVFMFKRVGVQYKDNVLLFSLDAALTLGPLTFSMAGLSFGSPLTKFAPVFDLDGLGIAYDKPPLEITGAVMKVPREELAPGVDFQFDGVVVIKTGEYSISGIASYAQMRSGDPSLFVFAQLEAALGGPPAFFITGLMLGFGFNRRLDLPAQDEVADFPLLALGQPSAPGRPPEKQDPMHVLDILEGRAPVKPGVQKAWIKPSPGDYWVAAGIQATHFGLVTSRLLLIVEFGNEFQVALLGLATMQLPQAETGLPSYVYVQVQLMAVLRPQEGFFGLTAILSNNSFLIAPACHLTGGLAFYLWFGPNEHAGEFVVTLGGYHPAFKPPPYYPQVPRLGFNWAVSDVVTVKGDAYFALTPSCVMAGGGLEVLFHSGNLRAWFTAHADLLVSWHPFFFLAHIDVDIGVSYRLNLLFCHKTISISVGATVDLWGPPTGGRAHVHLSIFSFTVGFGADEGGQNNTALGWGDFKSLLPAPADVCKVSVSSGLYKTQDSAAGNGGKTWVVRASNFGYFTQSAIPASHLSYGGPPHAPALGAGANDGSADGGSVARVLYAAADPDLDIRPMNLSGVTSTHNLSLFKNSVSSKPADVSGWSLTPRHQNVPESLWGAPPAPFTQIPDKPAAKVIPRQLVGYEVRAPQPAVGTTRGVLPLSELSEEYVVPPGAAPISTGVDASPDYVPGFDDKSVGLIGALMQAQAKGARDALYEALGKAHVYAGANGALDRMAATAAHIFSDPPMKQS